MTPHSSVQGWALQRIAEATLVPDNRRGDLDYLRAAVSLAHVYARAALVGGAMPDPPPWQHNHDEPDLFGRDT